MPLDPARVSETRAWLTKTEMKNSRLNEIVVRLLKAQITLTCFLVLTIMLSVQEASAMDAPTYVTEWHTRGWAIAYSPDNTLLVANSHQDRIEKYSSSGSLLQSWGTEGNGPGQFRNPLGIAVDGAGNVYVSDFELSRVQKFSPDGTFIRAWGAYGTAPGQFKIPKALTIAPSGNLLICDIGNNRIQEFSPDGAFVAVRVQGHVVGPFGIDTLPNGDIVVCDNSNRVRIFSSAGAVIRTWGIGGTQPGRFENPIAVTVALNDQIFVADRENHRVQVFTPTGQLLAVFGSVGGSPGEFRFPTDICASPDNSIFVIDGKNQRVQVFEFITQVIATTWSAIKSDPRHSSGGLTYRAISGGRR